MGDLLEFDRFLIDAKAFELRCEGKAIAVEPLVFDLILDLAANAGVLRTRDDLIATVWQGRIVSDTTISTAIKTARKVLGDTGEEKKVIRTVRGRGFQFIAAVSSPQKPITRPIAAPFPVLRIAVAALDDTVSPQTARALEARLRSVLDRIPFLSIGASGSEGGTHLFEVALSSIDETLYADVSLSDTDLGLQKWARHFSSPLARGVGELLTQIGTRAEPQILKEMSRFLASKNKDDPHALVLGAMQIVAGRGWNRSSIIEASELLERAISKDNSIPMAFAIVSLLNAIGYRVGMLRNDGSAVERAIHNAERALALESQNSSVLGLAGCALCDVGQLARGEPIIDRAIDLDPMNGHALAAKGAALMMKGNFEDALAPLRKSLEISPADSRLAVWGAILAAAELQCGLLDEANATAARAVSLDDVNYMPRLAAVAVHLARGDEMALKYSTRELLRVHPNITPDEVKFFVGRNTKELIWPIIEANR